jgi:arylsulfatase A-like enzyme
MKHRLNRRDFLKFAGLLPLSIAAPHVMRVFGIPQSVVDGQKNVLVIVFDAFSAYHVSMYGYSRETTPNLARLAKRAVVYHNHYAGGSFTTPGTASLLTGTLPWTHRAFQSKAGVAEPFASRNFFGAFQDYYRIAYTHNGWANVLLDQCVNDMDEHVPWKSLFLQSFSGFLQTFFGKDIDIASVSWTRNINIKQGYAYSLFLSHLYEIIQKNKFANLKAQFPNGLPSTGFADSEFLLENAIDWVGNRLPLIPQPYFGYFHFLPPHGPYNTSHEFYHFFSRDGFKPGNKPEGVFTEGETKEELLKMRTAYDEFILYVDKEFGRLFNYLETSGLLENTWVVVTSDHGELFERGISGHSTNALYQALIRIPLLIFEPGRTTGMDVYSPTSAIDLLPTLSYVTGKKAPEWAEGIILPPYALTSQDPNRRIYVLQAQENEQNAPIEKATVILIKGQYKLIYFVGDKKIKDIGLDELVQLFDIKSDPEELNDLYLSHREIAEEMLAEVKSKLSEVNKPYAKPLQ